MAKFLYTFIIAFSIDLLRLHKKKVVFFWPSLLRLNLFQLAALTLAALTLAALTLAALTLAALTKGCFFGPVCFA
jgi:hypothetical protein